MSKVKWPPWVWVNLSAEDFRDTYFIEEFERAFGSEHGDFAYQLDLVACHLLNIDTDRSIADADEARIWNWVMKLLGYTEICDE